MDEDMFAGCVFWREDITRDVLDMIGSGRPWRWIADEVSIALATKDMTKGEVDWDAIRQAVRTRWPNGAMWRPILVLARRKCRRLWPDCIECGE